METSLTLCWRLILTLSLCGGMAFNFPSLCVICPVLSIQSAKASQHWPLRTFIFALCSTCSTAQRLPRAGLASHDSVLCLCKAKSMQSDDKPVQPHILLQEWSTTSLQLHAGQCFDLSCLWPS